MRLPGYMGVWERAEVAVAVFAAALADESVRARVLPMMQVREAAASAARDGLGVPESAVFEALQEPTVVGGPGREGQRAALDIHRAMGSVSRLDDGLPSVQRIVEIATRAALMSTGRSDPFRSWELERAEDELAAWRQDVLGMSGEPGLIAAAMAWQGFESREPFGHLTGRIARVLAPALVCHAGKTRYPVLFVSAVLREAEDDAALAGNDDYFITMALAAFARAAEAGRGRIIELDRAAELVHDRLPEKRRGSRQSEAVDWMLAHPVFTVRQLADGIGCARQAADKFTARAVAANIAVEITGRGSHRIYEIPRLTM